MQKKSNLSTALWFIPLLAILLAVVFVGIYWIGKTLLNRSKIPTEHNSQKIRVQTQVSPQAQQAPAPVVPLSPMEEPEEEIVPEEVLDMQEELAQVPPTPAQQQTSTQEQQKATVEPAADVCAATTVPVKIKKPTRSVAYTPYERGLRQCKQRGIFPCAWEDKSAGVIKQYWLMSADGPITRGIYDMGGNLISETTASINGTVLSHTNQNITWYFQAGMLIKIRTTPYDNCKFHDWFFINENGKQDVCQCAYPTPNCCARSPYQEGMKRSYCELFPLENDFCK